MRTGFAERIVETQFNFGTSNTRRVILDCPEGEGDAGVTLNF